MTSHSNFKGSFFERPMDIAEGYLFEFDVIDRSVTARDNHLTGKRQLENKKCCIGLATMEK